MLIINDNSTCPTCGAYYDGQGHGANGHPGPSVLSRAEMHLQALRALTRPDAADSLALVDWLLRLVRFLELDLPAVLEVECTWGEVHALAEERQELPASLDDVATWLLVPWTAHQGWQNDREPPAACQTANSQAARILRALAALLRDEDPAQHLVTPAERILAQQAYKDAAGDEEALTADPEEARFGDLPDGITFRFIGERGKEALEGVGVCEFVKATPTELVVRPYTCASCGGGYNAIGDGVVWTHVCPDEVVGL